MILLSGRQSNKLALFRHVKMCPSPTKQKLRTAHKTYWPRLLSTLVFRESVVRRGLLEEVRVNVLILWGGIVSEEGIIAGGSLSISLVYFFACKYTMVMSAQAQESKQVAPCACACVSQCLYGLLCMIEVHCMLVSLVKTGLDSLFLRKEYYTCI